MKAQKNSKVYWSLLKNFLNNKKIRIIPLLFYKNRFITDFQEKFKLFKFFFSKQCCIIPNHSSLTADFNYITDNRLSTVTFSAKDIGKIIPNLDSNKAHEHDNTSIRMLKICSDSICVTLQMIFLSKLFELVCFVLNGKKEILLPFTKQATKKTLRIIVQFLYFWFEVKYLKDLLLMKCLTIHLLMNSSLKSSPVFNNQLLSINHEIFTSFDK